MNQTLRYLETTAPDLAKQVSRGDLSASDAFVEAMARRNPMVPNFGGALPASYNSDANIAKMPPAALRVFSTTMAGDSAPITAADFRPDEMAVLRNAVSNAVASGSGQIGYGDYGNGETFDEGTGRAINALTTLGGSLADTLGMARIQPNPDGSYSIVDKYDFDATKQKVDSAVEQRGVPQLLMDGLVQNGLLGVGNVVGNLFHPQGYGRDVRINIGTLPKK